MFRGIYNALPLSGGIRAWIKKTVPLRWKRQAQFRNYGVINELYLWRLDRDIETIAPIQNYFSNIFPELDTATEGTVWVYAKNGKELACHQFSLAHAGMHVVKLSELINQQGEYGTFMWHIKMPHSVASSEIVRKNLVYFTDRGYVCYEKSGKQPCFTHGVDRYAVFQRQETKKYRLFYADKSERSWIPEFPLNQGMQDEIDIVLLNRSASYQSFIITIYQNGGNAIHHAEVKVAPRGVEFFTLNQNVLSLLDNRDGYFVVEGLATHWGRPAIMRHFANGSLSVMHC